MGNILNEINPGLPVDVAGVTQVANIPAVHVPTVSKNFWPLQFNWTKIIVNQSAKISGAGAAGGAAGGGGAGLGWFAVHFKEIAIVAGAAAIIAAIIKLIKVLDKSIKVRYNKVVKALQRAQKDFTLNPDGMSMKNILPGYGGLGAKIGDFFGRLFTMNFGKKNGAASKNYNIGLYPFCNKYKEEIVRDFKCAVDAYNMIKVANETDQNESVAESEGKKVYESFHAVLEAKNALNEAGSESSSESGFSITDMSLKGGQFQYKGETVQLNKESVREICYSIIYNYADKYVNMDRVFKDLGITSGSLSDIDTSAVDKLHEILEKYGKVPEGNKYNKQYARLKEGYDSMLKHYYNIGDGIIKNFSKYTEAKDEKTSNLLVSAQEKLQNMWDSQKDVYNNNFSHVLIEIVSSEPYLAYLGFILQNVLPLFKTGLAGEADYVLDTYPVKDQYYLVRQTNAQGVLGSSFGSNKVRAKGNVALVKILEANREKKELKISLVGLVEGDFTNYGSIAHLNPDTKIVYDAFKDDNGQKKEVVLEYGKWLALDPYIVDNEDWKKEVTSSIFQREVGDSKAKKIETIFAIGDSDSSNENGEEYNTIAFAVYNDKIAGFERVDRIKLGTPIKKDEFVKLVTSEDADTPELNMEFKEASDVEDVVKRIKEYLPHDPALEAKTNEDVVKFVNQNSDLANAKSKISSIYRKTDEKIGEENIFAILPIPAESVDYSNLSHLNDNTINEDGEGDGEGEDKKPEDSSTAAGETPTGDEKDAVTPDKDTDVTNVLIFYRVKPGKKVGDSDSDYFSTSIVLDAEATMKDVKDNLKKISDKAESEEEKFAESTDKLTSAVRAKVIADASQNPWKNKKYSIDQLEFVIEEIENDLRGGKKGLTDEEKLKLIEDSTKEIFTNCIEFKFEKDGGDNRWHVKNEVTKDAGKPYTCTKWHGQEGTPDQPLITISDIVGPFYIGHDGGKTILSGKSRPTDKTDSTLICNIDDKPESLVNAVKQFATLKEGEKKDITAGEKPADASTQTDSSVSTPADASAKAPDASSGNQGGAPADASAKVESYKPSYSVENILTESVVIKRTFDNYVSSKWSILAESIYDDGTGKSSKIDNESFRQSLLERSDVYAYVKTRQNAKLYEGATESLFTVDREFGYVPSLSTPLYESEMLIKFDKSGKITEKVYLGKARIA